MKKEEVLRTIQKECKNIGPRCANHLYEAEIFCLEDLEKLGAEEAFFQIWKTNPQAVEINAMYLYALEGAIQEVNCLTLPQKRKDELKAYAESLRQSYQ